MKDAEAETTGQRAEGCNLVAWRIRQALVETGLRSRWLSIIRAGKEDWTLDGAVTQRGKPIAAGTGDKAHPGL